MTLILVWIDNWSQIYAERGKEDSKRVLRSMVDILVEVLRTTDRVTQHSDSTFAIILAETAPTGAAVLAERLGEKLQRDLGVPVRFGVAELPEDAVAVADLLTEAEQALEYARRSRVQVASR